MKTKPHSLKLAVIACMAMLAAVAALADFHVATSQDLQNALTSAAGNGANNIIWLANGYYSGNFNYNSSAFYNLTIQPEPGLTSTNIAIDGVGGGRDLNITGGGGIVTVSNITFIRNCGNYQIGALRIGAGGGGTTIVDGCRFLSPTNTSAMGLEIASGLDTTIRNCLVLGKTNGSAYDGDGINISGVTGHTWIYNCTMAGNYQGRGADITASAVLTVTNNVFQTNYSDGLYFSPPGETALVVVSNNVFNANGASGNNYGVNLGNFGTLNLGANIFNANKGGGAYVNVGVSAAIAGNTFNANGNGSYYGGGAFIGTLNLALVTGNTFSGNVGGYGGGGAYFGQ